MTDSYTKAAVGYERLREVLNAQPSVRDAGSAKIPRPLKGCIEFEHVNFSYVPGQSILSDKISVSRPGKSPLWWGPLVHAKTTSPV